MRVEGVDVTLRDNPFIETQTLIYTITFNSAGNILDYTYRNPDSSTWGRVATYSDSGRLISTDTRNSAGEPVSKQLYTYDEAGRLIAEQKISADSATSPSTTYAYDASGRKIKEQILDYNPDENGIIDIEGYDLFVLTRNTRLIKTIYDDQDTPVEVFLYNENGEITSRFEIAHDAEGKPLEVTQFIDDFGPRPLWKRMHAYDKHGRLIETKEAMAGKNVKHQTFTYDAHGYRAEEISYDPKGFVQNRTTYTRDYDEQDNWTVEVISGSAGGQEPLKPAKVSRRTLTYY